MSSPADRSFRPQQLLPLIVSELPRPASYWVGFSGGLDSTVLLHALAVLRAELPAPLRAVHIDHCLQPSSGDWAVHCRQVCDALGIELTSLVVDARAAPGESPEAAARRARYAAISGALGPQAMLLTAHHLDDQAETLLLQLLRGAGVEGLAAMPMLRPWQDQWHARPLLRWSRAALRDWAQTQGLRWVEDPSNAATAADRNYLRQRLMPLLHARWPGASQAIARSAVHCAEAAELIAEQSRVEFDRVADAEGRRLRVDRLCALPPAAARHLMRSWLKVLGAPPIPHRRLHEALGQLCRSRADATVRVAWEGVELRRFRGEVWLRRSTTPPCPAGLLHWGGGDVLDLGPGIGRLRRHLAPGGIDRERWERGRVEVGFRAAGLRCRPVGRQGSRSFKKLAQDVGMPPWLRSLAPLLYIDGEIAAVADRVVCEPFGAQPGASGWHLVWEDPGD